MHVRLVCWLVALGLFLTIPTSVRADDDLSKFVEQNRILAQKIKAEATGAIAQSRVLEKTDPEEAQSILQKALKQVQNSTALPAADQTQLTTQLLGRLRDVNEAVRVHKAAQAQAPLKELPKKPPADPPAQGPSGVAQKVIEKGNAAVDAGARLQEERNKGFGGAVGSIASSSVIPSGDVTFPKDWAEKTKLREKYAGPQLTAKEVALIKALNSVLSVDFDNKPLKDVIEYLQDRTGQSIIVDPAALKEANTDYTDPVSFKVNKASFRTILRKVLADNGLTYVIKEGTIQVTTPARARDMMVVRTYPISDLVAASGLANRFGPFVARAQMLSNVQTLIQTIKSSVDPTLWPENGGNGSITFYEPGMALLIRAPTEFHYQLSGLYGSGK
jgi:hypothetical protein